MRGLICYYSGSGNTKLACEAIAAKTSTIDFDLHDIVRDGIPELADYHLVGFATWTDFLNPPQRMKAFLESLPRQSHMPAFVFNTFGAFSAKTLASLDRWTQARGFHVIAGHSLHMPENYPPMIKRGQDFKDSPNKTELAAFEAFIAQLDRLAKSLSRGEAVPARQIGLSRFIPAFSRTHARRSMGEKLVDTSACTQCGVCRDRCPYAAIRLDPTPVFDQTKCYGCWSCYNHCPTQAIFTRNIGGIAQYAHPNEQLQKNLAGSLFVNQSGSDA
ncbi:EFR1 family ferrodoxin [Candidatus Bipolaricaulota bacterium]